MCLPAWSTAEFLDYETWHSIWGATAEVEREIVLESGHPRSSTPPPPGTPPSRPEFPTGDGFSASEEVGGRDRPRRRRAGPPAARVSPSLSSRSPSATPPPDRGMPSPRAGSVSRGRTTTPSSRSDSRMRGRSASPPVQTPPRAPAIRGDAGLAEAANARVVPRGALKRKKPSSGKKAEALDRLVDTLSGNKGDRESRDKLAREQAEWNHKYQADRMVLAQRMVHVREREARMEEKNKQEEQKRLYEESMTSQMLKIAESGVSVARVVEMRREFESLRGGGDSLALGVAEAGGSAAPASAGGQRPEGDGSGPAAGAGGIGGPEMRQEMTGGGGNGGRARG